MVKAIIERQIVSGTLTLYRETMEKMSEAEISDESYIYNNRITQIRGDLDLSLYRDETRDVAPTRYRFNDFIVTLYHPSSERQVPVAKVKKSHSLLDCTNETMVELGSTKPYSVEYSGTQYVPLNGVVCSRVSIPSVKWIGLCTEETTHLTVKIHSLEDLKELSHVLNDSKFLGVRHLTLIDCTPTPLGRLSSLDFRSLESLTLSPGDKLSTGFFLAPSCFERLRRLDLSSSIFTFKTSEVSSLRELVVRGGTLPTIDSRLGLLKIVDPAQLVVLSSILPPDLIELTNGIVRSFLRLKI